MDFFVKCCFYENWVGHCTLILFEVLVNGSGLSLLSPSSFPQNNWENLLSANTLRSSVLRKDSQHRLRILVSNSPKTTIRSQFCEITCEKKIKMDSVFIFYLFDSIIRPKSTLQNQVFSRNGCPKFKFNQKTNLSCVSCCIRSRRLSLILIFDKDWFWKLNRPQTCFWDGNWLQNVAYGRLHWWIL